MNDKTFQKRLKKMKERLKIESAKLTEIDYNNDEHLTLSGPPYLNTITNKRPHFMSHKSEAKSFEEAEERVKKFFQYARKNHDFNDYPHNTIPSKKWLENQKINKIR